MNITCALSGHRYPIVFGDQVGRWAVACSRCGHVQKPEPPRFVISMPEGYTPREVEAFRAGWNAALGYDEDDPRDFGSVP